MPASSALIVIDGSHGEGSGALLRTALTMSALTQQGVRISSVRGGSRYPGLDPEDLAILAPLTDSCSAHVVGAEIGSNTLSFSPTRRARGLTSRVEAVQNDMRRGPNALVVASALLPVLARTGMYSSVAIEGETYGTHCLSYDYFANVTVPALRQMGLYCYPDMAFAGFGRESVGEVKLDIEPSVLNGVDWTDRGAVRSIHGLAVSQGVPASVGDRIVEHLTNLARSVNMAMDIEHRSVEAKETGVFVTCWATYERGFGGGAAMGAKGVRAEAVAQNAFEEMFDWMSRDATVDPFVADHILVPASMAFGTTTFKVSRITQRFLTSVWVIKQFTPIHITVRGVENGPGTVTIRQ